MYRYAIYYIHTMYRYAIDYVCYVLCIGIQCLLANPWLGARHLHCDPKLSAL